MANTNSPDATLAALSDHEVIRRVRGGDVELFEVLMRRYNPRLYRAVWSILADADETEDVLQETYVRAYSRLNQFEGRAQFSTWLTKIAIHEAFARLRQQRHEVALRTLDESEVINLVPDWLRRTPEQELVLAGVREVLEEALRNLPPLYRSVFMLQHFEELNTKEIAETLEISEAAVKVRLNRARRRLRKEIFEHTDITSADVFDFLGERCDRVVTTVLARIRPLETKS